ncbi:MAG: tyrosinase [Caulobacter sp.]|nr:tyrosinase [Caulobacter sp.]
MGQFEQTRRVFMATTAAAAAGTTAFAAAPARTAPKYTRHNVTSPKGQEMLKSYAKGVAAMLALPPEHPHNWFRNAFVHLMDCPHGNWWFYVWHRGFIGYFEETIRNLSGNPEFALPYWDWTELPRIPEGLFDGPLTPASAAFAPTTGNLNIFTNKMKPAMKAYWDNLSSAQRSQLIKRGYKTFDLMWNDVTGYSPSADAGISGNMAYAITCGSRYLSPDNPGFDAKTLDAVSPAKIAAGLAPVDFYNEDNTRSFTSSKTPSHNTAPSGATKFSVLEGFPHNKVHNCIGGVGAVDPGPYGSMTNFLSPVDPIFFMHHANMDRLWDVWTRKQQAFGLPILPTGDDLRTLAEEPFLFYVNGKGEYVGHSKAGAYFDTAVFDYGYAPARDDGRLLTPRPKLKGRKAAPAPIMAQPDGQGATAAVPRGVIDDHLADRLPAPLIAQVTIARPGGYSTTREFDVLINAPPGVTHVEADSPYYAGTVSFFGPIMAMHGDHEGMEMSVDTTFAVPLPQKPQAFNLLGAAAPVAVSIRVIPAHDRDAAAPVLKGVSLHSY